MAFVQPFIFSGVCRGTHAEAHNHDMHGTSHDLVQDESGVWTCSMHPQIRQDKPGKCPICGMDLIPLKKNVISGGDAVSIPMPSGSLMRPWLSPMFRLPVSVAVTP